MNVDLLLVAIAEALLAGEQTVEEATRRTGLALGRDWPWLESLARRYLAEFAGGTRARRREVVGFLASDEAWVEHAHQISVARWLNEGQRMRPVNAAAGWDVPRIESAGALAAFLDVTPGELAWFADLKGLLRYRKSGARLQHYHYRVRAKGDGGIRLIEAPKPRLKTMQRRILAGILDAIPPHPAVHGFRKGRSIQTFVAPHVGQRVVLRMDLEQFFPSISRARVQAFFRTVGYPETVADALGGICTNVTPRHVWRPDQLREAYALYRMPHLPQGAPASPALANSCAYRVDCRLGGLAKSAGAAYTRYADDLAFSGGEDFERCVRRFSTHVAAILDEEGFRVHHRKTRIMRQGVRQHLAGLVANQKVNVIRKDFDVLKAILTNCVKSGPESQNREAVADFRAHLAGRVGFVEMINPVKAKRLRSLFDQIAWSE